MLACLRLRHAAAPLGPRLPVPQPVDALRVGVALLSVRVQRPSYPSLLRTRYAGEGRSIRSSNPSLPPVRLPAVPRPSSLVLTRFAFLSFAKHLVYTPRHHAGGPRPTKRRVRPPRLPRRASVMLPPAEGIPDENTCCLAFSSV